jgi:hypothetical protein
VITRRPALAVTAGLLAVPLLAACGGDDVGGTASPVSSSGSSAAESSESSAAGSSSGSPASGSSSAGSSAGTDLTPGLLPAEAFGAGAQVTPVTEAQLRQGATTAGASTEGLEVTPPECASAVQGTQPSFDDYDDVAAQVAVSGTTTTVQALASGDPAEDALAAFGDQLDRCSQVQVGSPQVGTATVTFQRLDVPDLGDGAAGVTFTTTATAPDGTQQTVPAHVGVVQDGDRIVLLLTTDATGATPDPTAFTALLQQAYDAQADALD